MKLGTIIKIQNTVLVTLVGIISLLFLIIFVSLSELTAYSLRKTCRTVGSYKDAQESLVYYPNLDKDKDGIACNYLK